MIVRPALSFCRQLPHAAGMVLLALCLMTARGEAAEEDTAGDKPPGPVSFYRQVRPILQRECAGCIGFIAPKTRPDDVRYTAAHFQRVALYR